MKRREKVASIGMAELCGGGVVTLTPVPVKDDGASAGAFPVTEEEVVSVTLILSFCPLVQCPDKVHVK